MPESQGQKGRERGGRRGSGEEWEREKEGEHGKEKRMEKRGAEAARRARTIFRRTSAFLVSRSAHTNPLCGSSGVSSRETCGGGQATTHKVNRVRERVCVRECV